MSKSCLSYVKVITFEGPLLLSKFLPMLKL